MKTENEKENIESKQCNIQQTHDVDLNEHKTNNTMQHKVMEN